MVPDVGELDEWDIGEYDVDGPVLVQTERLHQRLPDLLYGQDPVSGLPLEGRQSLVGFVNGACDITPEKKR